MGFETATLDMALHIVTFLVSVLIFALSIRAYNRNPSRRFMFICAAFGLFTFKELIIAIGILWGSIPGLGTISHLLNLGVLLAFFYGVIK